MSELHKSRFEGDNFRNRYMSKCQGESTSEEVERLASRVLELWRSGDDSFRISFAFDALEEALKS